LTRTLAAEKLEAWLQEPRSAAAILHTMGIVMTPGTEGITGARLHYKLNAVTGIAVNDGGRTAKVLFTLETPDGSDPTGAHVFQKNMGATFRLYDDGWRIED